MRVTPAYASKATVLLACLLLAPAAHTHAATLEGRIIHPQRPDAADGLVVRLLGVRSEGEPIERKTRTDAHGRFRLTELPTPAAYLLAATYEDITFPGGSVIFREEAPDETRQVTFHIYDATSNAARVGLRQVRWVLEREAGVYRVLQSFVISNPGLQVIVRDDSQPAVLRVGLAAGHGELETPIGGLPAGAKVLADVLELHGPIYPGEREVQLVYELAEAGVDLTTEIYLPDPTPNLEVYVRDFGIRVDPGALHPARPAREADMVYQRYVGFDLAAGTRIPFRVRALPPRSPTPSWAPALLAALSAAGLLLFLGQPVTRAVAPPLPAPERDEDRETEALVAALRDLEHDFETGKLSSEDRDRLRRDLRGEALRSRSQRRAQATPIAAPLARPCPCGRMPRPSDRFCAACGSRL